MLLRVLHFSIGLERTALSWDSHGLSSEQLEKTKWAGPLVFEIQILMRRNQLGFPLPEQSNCSEWKQLNHLQPALGFPKLLPA